MDFSNLKEINPDIVAWIDLGVSNYSYPVLRANDNEYYLKRMYNGEVNANGSIFMDFRNSADCSDMNIVLYGHHMNDGSMFASLSKYKDQRYYDKHPTMKLYTPTGDYLIELVSGTIEDGNYEFVDFHFSSGKALVQYVESFRRESTFKSDVEVGPDDRIITLCTCSYEQNNARYMVIGKLTPIMEE